MQTKKPSRLDRINLWLDQNGLNIIVVLLILFFVVVFFWKKIFVIVPAGHSAVLYKPFSGGTQQETYMEGLHIIWPWDELTSYDTRLQIRVDTVKAQTKAGLAVNMVYAARYILKRDKLSEIHRYIGPNYADKIVMPEAVSELREFLSHQIPDSIYTLSEQNLQSEFLENISAGAKDKWIAFEDIKVLRVITPKEFDEAVEKHHIQDQKSKEYEYRLAQEGKELERKKREAEGIAMFERIAGISYLKYRSIQATEALSTSQNAKVIVIGNGSKDIPVVLNGGN